MEELAEFGPKPPDDGLKIQWFQAGIECDLFTPVRAAIYDRLRTILDLTINGEAVTVEKSQNWGIFTFFLKIMRM
jgi:hypothetical protein